MTFELQRRTGQRPRPTAPRVAVGVEVTGRLGIGRLVLRLPCQVVWVVEEADRIGFGYGTMAGHPESGEEAFVVSRDRYGGVWLEIVAFSRPQRWFVRLAGPVGVLLQELATTGYVRAARALAARV